MSLRSRTLSLFRNLLGWGRVERELDDEMRSFLEMLAEEKRQAGLTPDAARRAALLELGGLEQVREQARDVRTGATLDALGRDLAYAARTLRKHAGFTAVATATLALGIGASTAVLSVVDTVVFRPLPYRDPDLLVKLCGATPQKTACDDDFSWPELLEARAQSQLFEQVAADDGTSQALVRPDGSREPVGVALVTTNWLATAPAATPRAPSTSRSRTSCSAASPGRRVAWGRPLARREAARRRGKRR
ncbi:MAG TPA: permease prefix domain 1-containing protein [Vicinamibacteria bacterium]|nr:permease prefix domain 1-containing protein [Vicinamibacteria bacterium]